MTTTIAKPWKSKGGERKLHATHCWCLVHMRRLTTTLQRIYVLEGSLSAFYLLLLCSSTWSLLLSADRILGSTNDSSASSITGSTALSLACIVFTYWQTNMSPNLREQAHHQLGLNDWLTRPRKLFHHLASPCAAVWPPELWTQRAESESVMMLPAVEPNPRSTTAPG